MSRFAFCIPPLRLSSPKALPSHFSASCSIPSASPNQSPSRPVSRRALLLAVGALVAAPFLRLPPCHSAELTQPESQLRGFQTRSGLKFIDFELGSGPTPKWGDLVNIQYVAYTITSSGDGLVKQDSSYDRGDVGYLIHHGNGEHIIGLEEAIHTMKPGGRRRVIIPSNLAYWKSGVGPVPPSARRRNAFSEALTDGDGSVVFDVELRTVMPDPKDRGYYNDLVPTDEEMIKIWELSKGQRAPDKE